MVEPQQDTALAADTPPLAAALLRLLRAMREAPDEVSLLARAVGALAGDGLGCAWVAGEGGDGTLRVLAAAGTG